MLILDAATGAPFADGDTHVKGEDNSVVHVRLQPTT
jgi:hypothetical protein